MIDVFSNGDDMRNIDEFNTEQDKLAAVDSKFKNLIEQLNFKISSLEARLMLLEARRASQDAPQLTKTEADWVQITLNIQAPGK
jgi:hypothetical protein